MATRTGESDVQTQSLVESVRSELHDPGGVRFSDPLMAEFLTSAARQVALLRPDEFSERAVIECAAGATQAIPDDGLRLIDVSHNVNDNDTEGGDIRRCDPDVLRRFAPGWRTEALVNAAEEYLWDDRRPREFLLVPPVNAGVKVEILYAQDPGVITGPDDDSQWGDIDKLPDSYFGAVRHWVLHRMYSIETSAVGKQSAHDHWTKFYNTLGETVPSEIRIDPRRTQAVSREGGGDE